MSIAAVEIDKLHYESRVVRVGSFRCPPSYPMFDSAGPITGYVLAFPRSSVYIHYGGEQRPIVADPNVVMMYNPGQPYRREKLSEEGDVTDWVEISPAILREVLLPYDPQVVDREKRLFLFSHGPSAAEVYMLQRLVQQHARDPEQRDPLFIEEMLQHILARVVAFAYRARGRREAPARPRTQRVHREMVQEARAVLARDFHAPVTLDDLAQILFTSPYHLARVFRRETGQTIHNYRNQIRLRAALEPVADGQTSLTEIALALGYSSHAHFTASFSKTFGLPPSSLREAASLGRVREMSKILKA